MLDVRCEELRCLACYHICHYSKVGHKPTPQALELGSVFSHLTFYYKQSNFYHTNKTVSCKVFIYDCTALGVLIENDNTLMYMWSFWMVIPLASLLP